PAEDKDKQIPEQQYKALLKEYQDGFTAYREAATKAKTNEERQKAFEKFPRPEKFAPKFLALAEKHPKDPVAVDALVWVATNNSGRGGKDTPQAKALAILQRDHAASPKLAPVCQRLVYGMDKATESFLRTVLEKSQSKAGQGNACLALAQFLKNRASTVEQFKTQPRYEAAYAGMLGKDYLEELKKLDPTKGAKEVETLLERAARDYADVASGYRGTIGSVAKS